jgi:3-oxoacyl-[acyl-carrier-protein] synthase II
MRGSEVVISGVGVVSPIGVGREAFWAALLAGRSGVGRMSGLDASPLPVRVAAEVRGFDPKAFIANRKSLKVMSRDAQLGMAAAALACRDAGLAAGGVDPDRFGIVLGADRICGPISESEVTYGGCFVDGRFQFQRWVSSAMASYPLGFLRVLPNMIASHISIVHDARGPNNTIHQSEISSLLAVHEAAGVIDRGVADVMMAGGASSQLHVFDYVRRSAMGILSPREEDPAAVSRPFDAGRDGQVWGEGAAILILEARRHAEARGARIHARLPAGAATCESAAHNGYCQGGSLGRAMQLALERAGLRAADVGHVNAHGLSTVRDDRIEAKAIHATLPGVPVTALKSYFGNLGAAGAAMQLAASVLAFRQGQVPATLNYERPDPECPVPVIRGGPMPSAAAAALALAWMPVGQAAALVVAAPG